MIILYVKSKLILMEFECHLYLKSFIIQDSFGRLHDRTKDAPKTMKQLTRLFPNKVSIQMPQVIIFYGGFFILVIKYVIENSNNTI